jgi:uncharacterized membrane protein
MTGGTNQPPPPPPDERQPGYGGGWDAPPPPPPPPGGEGWTDEQPGPGYGQGGPGYGQGGPGYGQGGPGYGQRGPGGQGSGMDARAASGLCYVLTIVTGVIFLIIDKRPEVRFHAMQAILFGIAWAVVGILRQVVDVFPLNVVWFLLWLGGLVMWVVLMIRAFQGQHYKLPWIGDIAEQQASRPL